MKFIGLMSGTSLDGVDVVMLEVEGSTPGSFAWELVHFHTSRYERERWELIRAGVEGGGPRELCLLHASLGEWMAEAVLEGCRSSGVEPRDVRAVGSHGQTIWHEPPAAGERGATWQLGDPATLAERTGIDVVSDLRSRDVAAGGHGAPLVPFADRLLFSRAGTRRALQNLGGMGNVTWIPETGSEQPTAAFDTGPGVALLDAAAERATGGRLRYDEEGALAARGTVDEALLSDLLSHPFFAEPPPRTTGREVFGTPLVRRLAEERGLVAGEGEEEGWADLLATFTALTARSVGDAYRRWVLPLGVDEVVLTGGGARNPVLARAIARELDPVPVRTGDDALELDPDAREAAAFAVLAWAHVNGVPGNVPGATGAEGPRVLGSLTPGRRDG